MEKDAFLDIEIPAVDPQEMTYTDFSVVRGAIARVQDIAETINQHPLRHPLRRMGEVATQFMNAFGGEQ